MKTGETFRRKKTRNRRNTITESPKNVIIEGTSNRSFDDDTKPIINFNIQQS